MLERLKVRGEGNDRGWDGWMASSTRWTWVWGCSGCWWWIGKPGVLQSMGSQRVGHDWVTELNWTELKIWIWGTLVSGHMPIALVEQGTLNCRQKLRKKSGMKIRVHLLCFPLQQTIPLVFSILNTTIHCSQWCCAWYDGSSVCLACALSHRCFSRWITWDRWTYLHVAFQPRGSQTRLLWSMMISGL